MMLLCVRTAEANPEYMTQDIDLTVYSGLDGATSVRGHGKRSRWIMGYFIVGMVVGSLGTMVILILMKVGSEDDD